MNADVEPRNGILGTLAKIVLETNKLGRMFNWNIPVLDQSVKKIVIVSIRSEYSLGTTDGMSYTVRPRV